MLLGGNPHEQIPKQIGVSTFWKLNLLSVYLQVEM